MNINKHSFGQWLVAVRPWSFPASAMPVIVTVAYLLWKGCDINWLFSLWALLNIVVFHAAGNTWSDYFDYKHSVDREDTFGAKTLTGKMFEPREIFRLSVGLTVVAVVAGVVLAMFAGLQLVWIGVGGVLCTLLYPTLKFNAFGDVVILLAYAFLPTLGTSFVATGMIDFSVLWLALPIGLITDGILHSNNTRDIVSDGRAGISTLAMIVGAGVSAGLYVFYMIFPFVWVAALALTGIFPLAAIAVVAVFPLAFNCAKIMMSSVKGGALLIADLDVKTANLQLVFSLLLSISFFITAVL